MSRCRENWLPWPAAFRRFEETGSGLELAPTFIVYGIVLRVLTRRRLRFDWPVRIPPLKASALGRTRREELSKYPQELPVRRYLACAPGRFRSLGRPGRDITSIGETLVVILLYDSGAVSAAIATFDDGQAVGSCHLDRRVAGAPLEDRRGISSTAVVVHEKPNGSDQSYGDSKQIVTGFDRHGLPTCDDRNAQPHGIQ
jgi:hypothetical protein